MSRLTNCQGFIHECMDCVEEDNCYGFLCGKIEEAIKKLADYEDKEEQGLLRIFPCKVGDTIYVIHSKVNYDLNVLNGFAHLNKVHKQKVHSIELYGDNRYLVVTCEGMSSVLSDSFKETWFLIEAEAEEALAKMGGK